MKRREFINKSVQAGIATGTALSLASPSALLANEEAKPIDLVAVRGGTPEQMFDQGIAALGGMKKFVKKGQKVLVKPNIGWNKGPEYAANTNPELVKRIIEHCFKAGASEVYVTDHTCHKWQLCYSNSGIEAAAKAAGAKVLPGNSENYYHEVSISQAESLKKTKVHQLLNDTDVFINVPVLKDHSSTRVSLAMKNLMGCVWDRGFYHKNDLNQCIVDFLYHRVPDLNVVDAYRAMAQNGPVGVSTDDVLSVGAQLLSTDIVAIDAASVKFLKRDPEKIGHITLAHKHGFGNMNLAELNIHRIKI